MTGTVHGNTVITATAAVREPGDTQTYASDVNALLSGARKLVPDLDTRRVVRAFAGGRPVIQGTNDFFIGQSAVVPGLFQAAGIQSPGVASAPAIAEHMELVMREAGVKLHERADWNPIRRAPDDFDRAPLTRKEELIESDPAWGQIVCRCETVPEAEIVAAIRRRPGAISVEGVKRAVVPAWVGAKAAFARAVWWRFLPESWAATPARCCWRIPDLGWSRDL